VRLARERLARLCSIRHLALLLIRPSRRRLGAYRRIQRRPGGRVGPAPSA